MTGKPIVMYIGGFAKVGGIEAFTRDFLLTIAEAYPERQLVMWGAHEKQNVLLTDIAESGVKIAASPWRWGCRWNLPDFVLAPIGRNAVRNAAAVIFKRPPPRSICRWLRQSCRHVPFILITPYRPSEYWGERLHASELEDFDAIVVQSDEGVADLAKAGYRGRIENIPLLPPKSDLLIPYPSARGAGVTRLGFLGRMVAQKNLGYLLGVFRVLTRDVDAGHRYELHLFGDGELRDELEQRSENESLRGVFFHGETPRGAVPRAIDSCDLFLITSLTEGQCLVALEVLARGRPLVATPVGALPEVLRRSELGRLAPLGDAAAYAAVVAGLAACIHAGRVTPQSVAAVFRERYDYHSIRQRYLDLLADLGAAAPKISA